MLTEVRIREIVTCPLPHSWAPTGLGSELKLFSQALFSAQLL